MNGKKKHVVKASLASDPCRNSIRSKSSGKILLSISTLPSLPTTGDFKKITHMRRGKGSVDFMTLGFAQIEKKLKLVSQNLPHLSHR